MPQVKAPTKRTHLLIDDLTASTVATIASNSERSRSWVMRRALRLGLHQLGTPIPTPTPREETRP